MRLLVATRRTQGDVRGDYDYCVAGELLWITEVCGRDLRDPEQGCGCGRGFGGLTSHRATTTAEVADLEFTEDDVRLAVRTSLTDQGWLPADMDEVEQDGVVEEVVGAVRAIAAALPPGTVVRRNRYDFHAFPAQRH